jgi:hypothetical protein
MVRRNCAKVINEMIGKIPSENVELIKDLHWNLDDSRMKAPEETLQWNRTFGTLIKHLPNPIKDWEFEIISIFTGVPTDELKAEILNNNKG